VAGREQDPEKFKEKLTLSDPDELLSDDFLLI